MAADGPERHRCEKRRSPLRSGTIATRRTAALGRGWVYRTTATTAVPRASPPSHRGGTASYSNRQSEGASKSETMQTMKGFELQPHLVGELVELRPLRPEDWEELFAVAADPLIWEVHPARDRSTWIRFKGVLTFLQRVAVAVLTQPERSQGE
jgi:hypothetical protein